MGCRSFFDENIGNATKCKLLQEISQDELNSWEVESASAFSPGVVENSEILYQQIVDPTHFDPVRQTLKPTAFQDSANKGLSVNRLKHSTFASLVQRGMSRAEEYNGRNPEKGIRSLWGFACFDAQEIRQIYTKSDNDVDFRGLFIFDTALADDISHADICQGVKGDKQGRSIRSKLYDLAKKNLLQL